MALAFAHVPTMLAMIILSSLTTAGGMAVVGAERRHDGVQWWALGLLFNAVAHLLFALRGTIPDIFSIVLGNTLLMGCTCPCWRPCCSSRGADCRAPPQWRYRC